MRPLVIFGIGDFAEVAFHYLTTDGGFDVMAFTADGEYLRSSTLLQRDVIPFEQLSQRFGPSECELFVAIGYSQLNRLRQNIVDRCKSLGYRLASYVSSEATCHGPIEVGENSFIFERNVIQPQVKIGNNVVLWSGNHIGHHSTIEDHCFLASHVVVAGRVTVGHHSFLGVNCTVADGVTIGPENIIGAGALITRDTKAAAVYRPRGTKPSTVASSQLWR